MSKVSVIVPIYNAGNKLEKCIKSILNQSFSDFELILINDGSTDNSLQICEKFKKQDQRITLISKSNEGLIATRQKGINVAKCEYVMFVDADDLVHCDILKILYNESIDNSADVTVCNMQKFIGSPKILKKETPNDYFQNEKVYNKDEIKNELVTAYFHGHPFPSSLCAKLYKKDLLINSGKYLDRIQFLGEDLFFNMEILLNANSVKIVNKSLYYYRLGGNTQKFMPYLFDDMVNGYLIQKEVINKHYKNSYTYNGISIMLLNTFKSCLTNLFNSKFNEKQIKETIKEYTLNQAVRECIKNEGAIKYFPKEYLEAIIHHNEEYLFDLGNKVYTSNKLRKTIFNLISKIA
jgi:glycosyltransferase involved in cell wall biosynthesis